MKNVAVILAALAFSTGIGQVQKTSMTQGEVWSAMVRHLQTNKLSCDLHLERFGSKPGASDSSVQYDRSQSPQKRVLVYGLSQFAPDPSGQDCTPVSPNLQATAETFVGSGTKAYRIEVKDLAKSKLKVPAPLIWIYVDEKTLLPVGFKKSYRDQPLIFVGTFSNLKLQ